MRHSFRFPIALAALVVTGLAARTHPAAAQMDADTEAVVDVVNRFHAALADGRGEDALALLAEDAVILEGGGSETKDEYASGHLGSDMAFAQAVPRERGEPTVRIEGDVAWVTSTSHAVGEWRGREIDSRGGELMVLTRTADGWIIRSISWS